MKISATIALEEHDFEITPPINENELWVGKKINDNSNINYFNFIIENGLINNLLVHESIDTDDGIILERLIDVIKQYNESRQMGFEGEESLSSSESEEMKPYDPEQIRVRPLVLSAFQVHRDIQRNKIDLNPEFQRNFVWDDIRKSLLIESMLLKIPLPAFYFAEDNDGKFQVVDGLQRLTVINQFLNNEFKLRNLEYLKKLEGRYFSIDLEKGIFENEALFDPYDGRVESTQLNINVIESSSPLRVKYDIFYRINTGGRPLNRQEIRNCFATDTVRRLLKRMANNEIFNQATGFSVNDIRMDAQELALRYIAFHLFRETYNGDINPFLDNTLEKINYITQQEVDNLENNFYKSLRCSNHLFGGYAFRKCLPQHLLPGVRRQFLNKAMFLTWTVILSYEDESKVFSKSAGEFVHQLAEKLSINSDLLNSLTNGTTDKNNLEYVFREFQGLLHDYLN